MAQEDSQFVATGPIETASDPDFAAFSTGWTNPEFDYGANVQGGICGVYGTALHGGERRAPQNVPKGMGVCAIGIQTGLYAETTEGGVGVRAESVGRHSGEGVRGTGNVKGVVGVTEPSRGAEGDFRAGVFGTVNAELEPLPPAIVREMGDAGVAGVSSPRGPGVVGISQSGAAIDGRSHRGPAGLFQSAHAAQIRLHLDLTEPPEQGTAGELLATATSAPISPDPEASLWFCTKGSVPGRPASWTRLA
ncbi:MAG TPA: hypothetical protein VFX45_10515 [Solirubrobacterales bacterium]|nr:hypothetical protein [Solirubrobacterales bacterium]